MWKRNFITGRHDARWYSCAVLCPWHSTNSELRLRTVKVVKEVWLADDATSGGKLEPLKQWWDIVIEEGAKFGYHVNDK